MQPTIRPKSLLSAAKNAFVPRILVTLLLLLTHDADLSQKVLDDCVLSPQILLHHDLTGCQAVSEVAKCCLNMLFLEIGTATAAA